MQLVVVPVLEKIQRLSFRVLFHCQIQELEIVKRLFKYTFGCSKMDISVHQKKNHSQYYDNRFNDLRSGKRLIQLMAFLLFQKIRAGKLLVSPQILPPPPFFFLLKGCRNEHKNTKFPFCLTFKYQEN